MSSILTAANGSVKRVEFHDPVPMRPAAVVIGEPQSTWLDVKLTQAGLTGALD